MENKELDYEALNKLFKKVCKVFDKLGEQLCIDEIIQCPIPKTAFRNHANQVYYVHSENGTMSYASPFSVWNTLEESNDGHIAYYYESMFRWYEGELKEQMIKNLLENKGISIINFFDSEIGGLDYSVEIHNEEDFKRHLIEDMALLEYDYTEEEIDEWLKD